MEGTGGGGTTAGSGAVVRTSEALKGERKSGVISAMHANVSVCLV